MSPILFSMTTRRLLAAVMLAAALAACETQIEQRFCTTVAVDAMTVLVTDGLSHKRICDATVTVRDGDFTAELRPFEGPECAYSGPTERAGRYDVSVTRDGYTAASLTGVTVTADECHVMPIQLGFALDPVAGPSGR